MPDRTRAWVNTTPADSDKVGKGDDEIRNLRVDIQERDAEGGHVTGVSVVIDGRHAVDAGGSTNGSSPDIYKSNGTDRLLAFTDAGVTLDPDALGGIEWAGPGITSNLAAGPDPGHTHTGAIIFAIPGVVPTGRALLAYLAPRALTITSGDLICFVTPTATNCTAQVHIASAPALSDNPNSISDLLVFNTEPAIIPGNFAANSVDFTTTAVAAGDWLIAEVTASSAVEDLMIILTVH